MKQPILPLPILKFTLAISALLLSVALVPGAQAKDEQLLARSIIEHRINPTIDIGISVTEARKLAEYVGLTGRQSLPPDIENKLLQGAPLSPCIAVESVSGEMYRALPYIEGHEWLIVGTDLVLVVIGTDRTVSVLSGVFH